MPDAAPESVQLDPSAPKRRGKVRKSHTVGKVLLATVLVMAMVTGLGTIWLYRHLNGNINVYDPSAQMSNRPDVIEVEGPKEPLNVLVMGSDNRDCEGCNIDNLTGGGARSDTTILLHVSADRQRAYGVSIPRDSMVERPECRTEDGEAIPGSSRAMWNEAFALGGPACTMQQFEQLTGVRLDHFVVVDFEGFRGMVDAIGGVEMCIPEPISDPAHGINIEAGTRKLEGFEALNYVRARYSIGNGSDTGRMKRQQAFLASMTHSVVSAGTLARPDRLIRFLDAATDSLTVDPGLKSIKKIADLGFQFRDIGLDKVQFITIPNIPDPADPNRLVWTEPQASEVWDKIAHDEPLTKKLGQDVISAGNLPGSGSNGGPKNEADAQALADAGLCT